MTSIYIGNLSYQATEEDLRQAFAQYGELSAVNIIKDRELMFETYEGEVVEVGNDSVVVIYKVEGDLVEQTYLRRQFLDGKLPEKGDRLAVHVHVVKLTPPSAEQPVNLQEPDTSDEQTQSRRNVVEFPRTFR